MTILQKLDLVASIHSIAPFQWRISHDQAGSNKRCHIMWLVRFKNQSIFRRALDDSKRNGIRHLRKIGMKYPMRRARGTKSVVQIIDSHRVVLQHYNRFVMCVSSIVVEVEPRTSHQNCFRVRRYSSALKFWTEHELVLWEFVVGNNCITSYQKTNSLILVFSSCLKRKKSCLDLLERSIIAFASILVSYTLSKDIIPQSASLSKR